MENVKNQFDFITTQLLDLNAQIMFLTRELRDVKEKLGNGNNSKEK